jgi:hypothetical protein
MNWVIPTSHARPPSPHRNYLAKSHYEADYKKRHYPFVIAFHRVP